MTTEKSNNIVRFGKVALEIGILLFAVGIAWATLKGKVDTNKYGINGNYKKIEAHDIELKTVKIEMSEIKADIREIKVGQRYISKGIDEIKARIK